MRRRDTAFGLFALGALAPAVRAQQVSRRVGVLVTTTPAISFREIFEARLKALGWQEGRNLVLVYRSADGKLERLPELADELVRAKVEVIVTFLNPATLAVKRAAPSIPIVMAIGANPVAAGIVQSLAHPGGNITGMSFDAAPETYGKQLELLREIVPGIRRAGVFWESAVAGQVSYVAALDQAANTLRIELRYHDFTVIKDIASPFESMRASAAAGFVTIGGPVILQRRKELTELAAMYRLPGIWHARAMAEIGGLIAYGPTSGQFWLRAAEYVDRILRGVKPADLPVQQPTEFELVVNMKSAKALGLTIPQSILIRATEVIE